MVGLPCLMTLDVRRLRTLLLLRKIGIICCWRCIRCLSRARLMATTQIESGVWLNALPVSSLGTLLDIESFRVAIKVKVLLGYIPN